MTTEEEKSNMAATISATEPALKPGYGTVFSGCSEEDQACAKLFWQSLTLQPPIESRLVSGDVRQRLKVAPPGSQTVHQPYEKIQTSQKLTEFLKRAQAEIAYEQSMTLTSQAIARHETRGILQKRKQERREKEAISHRPAIPNLMDEEDDYNEALEREASQAMAELDSFEQRINNAEGSR